MHTNGQDPKIQRMDIFNIRFYEKSQFHGSFRGMHYRIEKITDEKEEKKAARHHLAPVLTTSTILTAA